VERSDTHHSIPAIDGYRYAPPILREFFNFVDKTVIMKVNLQQDFFSLFDFPAQFKIDTTSLEKNYRALQSQVHPDKYSHLSETERRISMQWATHVNEAYQTLRSPLNRARYLLTLNGVDTQEETNTAMPVDFLMQQMEWREALADAKQLKNTEALTEIEQKVKRMQQTLEQKMALDLDSTHDYEAASGIVRKLKFIEKLTEEIGSAFDELDI
jgi:molecular chaperone HscB